MHCVIGWLRGSESQWTSELSHSCLFYPQTKKQLWEFVQKNSPRK